MEKVIILNIKHSIFIAALTKREDKLLSLTTSGVKKQLESLSYFIFVEIYRYHFKNKIKRANKMS